MKKIILFVLVLFAIGQNAESGLIGDTVNIGHWFNQQYVRQTNRIVEEGLGDIWYYSQTYTVNVEDNAILVDFIIPDTTHFSGNPVPSNPSPSFNGLIVSDIDNITPLIDVSVDTNMSGWSNARRLEIGDDYVKFNFEQMTIGPWAYFYANLTFAEVPDTDGDGIPDDEDACPNSDLTDTVIIDDCDSGVDNVLFDDGCTISDLIWQCADGASDHGEFVSGVSHMTKYIKKEGTISNKEKKEIQNCATSANIP